MKYLILASLIVISEGAAAQVKREIIEVTNTNLPKVISRIQQRANPPDIKIDQPLYLTTKDGQWIHANKLIFGLVGRIIIHDANIKIIVDDQIVPAFRGQIIIASWNKLPPPPSKAHVGPPGVPSRRPEESGMWGIGGGLGVNGISSGSVYLKLAKIPVQSFRVSLRGTDGGDGGDGGRGGDGAAGNRGADAIKGLFDCRARGQDGGTGGSAGPGGIGGRAGACGRSGDLYLYVDNLDLPAWYAARGSIGLDQTTARPGQNGKTGEDGTPGIGGQGGSGDGLCNDGHGGSGGIVDRKYSVAPWPTPESCEPSRVFMIGEDK